jgi:hypothetical protein
MGNSLSSDMMLIWRCQLKNVAIEYFLKKLPQNGQNLGTCKMREL